MNSKTAFVGGLTQLYRKYYQEDPKSVSLLPASGSERRYIRFIKKDNTSVMGAYNPDRTENTCFFYLSQVFSKEKLPVPRIIEVSKDKQSYLLEDLGTETLFDIINKEGHTERVKGFLKKAIDQLVRFHWQTLGAIDYSLFLGSGAFDQRQIFSDLLYFKYYFVDPLKISYNKTILQDEFSDWSQGLAVRHPQTFMYRDFQSRNILIRDKEVFFVDYQGGMKGMPAYDLASLLWQARAQFPNSWKAELVNYYFTALAALGGHSDLDETEFRKAYFECVLLRMMQTLGAYGFRGLIQEKRHFLKSIVPALQQLSGFLDEYPQYPNYNEFRKLLELLVSPEIINQFDEFDYPQENVEKLKINIFSFSYKKGLPDEESPHGGGFVFDCRGILNPGRQEAYKALTGKEQPVIDFLEQETKMPEFMKGVYSILDISVSEYLNRGFDYLSVAFGCTGGQHRSVYAAEALTRHLKEQFGISPGVFHLEQEETSFNRR